MGLRIYINSLGILGSSFFFVPMLWAAVCYQSITKYLNKKKKKKKLAVLLHTRWECHFNIGPIIFKLNLTFPPFFGSPFITQRLNGLWKLMVCWFPMGVSDMMQYDWTNWSGIVFYVRICEVCQVHDLSRGVLYGISMFIVTNQTFLYLLCYFITCL